MTEGQVWQDWSWQLYRYFEQINSYIIAKEILFHATQFEDQRIVPEEITAIVKCSREEVLQVLKHLALAGMIEVSAGYVFRNVKDPVLHDFIRSQYALHIKYQPWEQVYHELLQKYQKRSRDQRVAADVRY